MRAFYIVGPTATGKSELAVEVAQACEGEIVGADAFQLYAGLPLLTAQPTLETLARVPHHLIGTVPLSEDMNVERFRREALAAIAEIEARGRRAIVVGGSGMYIKALTHGLSSLPAAHPALREELETASTEELHAQLARLDPVTAQTIDRQNRRRLIRALEICRLTNAPLAVARAAWKQPGSTCGVFVFRDRAGLHERINQRVEGLFTQGVLEEVAAVGEVSSTAAKAIGLEPIRAHLAGKISRAECIASIQQATRQYAKRQLTWFRRQDIFEPLNLTGQSWAESVEFITRRARLFFASE